MLSFGEALICARYVESVEVGSAVDAWMSSRLSAFVIAAEEVMLHSLSGKERDVVLAKVLARGWCLALVSMACF